MPWHEAPHRPWWEDFIHPTRDFPARAALQDLRRDGWTVEDIQAHDTPLGGARYVFTLVHGATRIPCGPALARGCDVKAAGQRSPTFTAWAAFPELIRTLSRAPHQTRPEWPGCGWRSCSPDGGSSTLPCCLRGYRNI